MKVFLGKIKRPVVFWLMVVVLVQTAVYLLAGAGKAYLHMDEAFSLGLTHFEQIDLASQPDFYDHWHTNEYFEEYLAVDEDAVWDLRPVIENQKNDVHPPLYYLLLRLGQNTIAGKYSKWPGIIINVVIAVGNTLLVFAILQKLLVREKKGQMKALVMTAVVALTIATVSSVVYIRMYQLLTFWVLLTAWLHLKLYSSEKMDWKLLLGIGLTALAGVLTQYYYLFFLMPMWVVLAVKYARMKKWKSLCGYTGVLVMAGGLSLLIWPPMLQHMFFGYRGQGVLQSLLNIPQLIGQVWQYVMIVDYYDFHRMLILLVAALVVVWLIRNFRIEKTAMKTEEKSTWELKVGLRFGVGKVADSEKQSLWPVVVWPTLVYFLVVAAVSPYIELRYIMPVCGLILIVMVWWLYLALGKVMSSRKRDGLVAGFLGIMMVAAPVQLMSGMMRIELLYNDKTELMQELRQNSEVPTVYFISTENNRFLDNLLPFVTMKQSYLALDLRPTRVEVEQIVRGRDLSRGLYVWISDQYDHEEVLEIVEQATDLREVRHVRGVNTCDIYYLSN